MRSFPRHLVVECVGGKEVDKAMNSVHKVSLFPSFL